jgi:hypothetical protein
MFIALVLLIGVSILWNLQVGAYDVFTADPPASSNCSQCHTDWPGATHDFHSGAFSCDNCHNPFGTPVATSSCSACHPAGGVLELHSPLEGPGDQAYCGYCHAGVNAEERNWGEVKSLFR